MCMPCMQVVYIYILRLVCRTLYVSNFSQILEFRIYSGIPNSEFELNLTTVSFWVPARGTGNGVNGGTTCSSKFRIPNLYSTPRTAVQVPYSTVPYCTTVCTVQYRTVRYRTYRTYGTRQLLVLCTVVQVERYCTVLYRKRCNGTSSSCSAVL